MAVWSLTEFARSAKEIPLYAGTPARRCSTREDGRCPARTGDLLLVRREHLLRFAAVCRFHGASTGPPPFSAGTGHRASYSDDDLALGVSFSLVVESHRNLVQLVAAIDDGRERSCVDELLQRNQVLPVVPHNENPHLLAHER